MEIVTGHENAAHVTATDDAALNIALYGKGEYVLESGNQFAYTIVSNNNVTLKDGDVLCQGRHARTTANQVDACVIDNGTQGRIRHDIIVARYTKASTGVEKMEIAVVKGTAGTTGVDPALTTGDIQAGALKHEMPLYRVIINGLNISAVQQMFAVFPTLRKIRSGTALPPVGEEGDIFLLRES